MDSSPLRPPSQEPWEDEDFRFKTIGTACEWAEAYHPGGYHAVQLGDVINNQYRVVRKLGWGQFSTVWLVVDTQLDRYVSLKITVARTEDRGGKELFFCRSYLSGGCAYIVRLHDAFTIAGPNGKHDALVLEVMGPNLSELLRKRPEFQVGEPWERRFTTAFAKRALLDTLKALDFLHERDMVHGDLHFGNIRTCIGQLKVSAETESKLQQSIGEGQPLERKDGKRDLWAPLYLLEPRPLDENFSYEIEPLVKLADLGGAFCSKVPITGTDAVTPVALWAPEAILGDVVGKGLDIWCFGCLIFEMLVGRPLFVGLQSLEGKAYDEITNDEHLCQIWDVIGLFPQSLREKWRRADKYFGPDGEKLQSQDGGEENPNDDDDENIGDTGNGASPGAESNEKMSDISSVSLAYPGEYSSLQHQLTDEKPDDIKEAEEEEILHLLRWIFQYDPSHRPSTAKLLDHPWFSRSRGNGSDDKQ
ncbi:kinase-like domain-containing protein [Fusarium flagelliforme]|uniref:kinase-like domain-containing protein n=1 Tax=Fusarium flagelliforme TaxID=2675880 RepID=UPI001E8DC361|nr:kinase-like domain-containing protein [Fusarium flagelliforme]KAH7184530.1 kinase-like domain-containing protein [Fusarium flagelliforme]